MFGVDPIAPAYGRQYKSLKEAQADLDGDKDFRTPNGQYISRKELLQIGMRTINIRYGAGLTKVGVLKIREVQ